MIDILTYPFMQRAFIAGMMVAVLLGWLGVYAISRKMSFVGDSVAHASLAAVAVALLLGWTPLPIALVGSMVIACGIQLLGNIKKVSHDTALGIIFVTGMALGVILLQFHNGYMPELMTYLFGNILAIRSSDLLITLVVGIFIVCCLFVFRRQFMFLTIDPEGARLSGMKRPMAELLLTMCIALSVVLSMKIVGIVLVSGLLILPSTVGKMTARSFAQFEWQAIFSSILFVFVGLVLSYYLDIPSGATIVLVGVVTLVVVALLSRIRPQSKC